MARLGWRIVSGGTDNHLIVIDVSPLNITGKEAAIDLEKAGMVLNYNTVPFDTNPPTNPSGIRLGTPAMTSRGLKEPQMRFVGRLLSQVLKKEVTVDTARKDIGLLCSRFPIPEMY